MAKTQRTYWKGHLRLSLVSIAIELYPAVARSNRLTLHQLHKPSGERIRYQKVVPGIGPVDTDEIVKGVDMGDDTYVVVEPDELENLKLESRHTIDLVQFVAQGEVDPRYFDRPYYVRPGNDVSIEGFQIIREALRETGKLALGQLAMRGQEYLVAIKPCGRGMLLETLRYADEVRSSDDLFDDLPGATALDTEKVELAEQLIARKTAPFDASAFRDKYGDALRELIDAKRGKHEVVATGGEASPRRKAEVVDLMAALKKSVAGDRGAARNKDKASRQRGATPRKRAKAADKSQARPRRNAAASDRKRSAQESPARRRKRSTS